MKKCNDKGITEDERFGNENICTNQEYSSVKPKELLPLRINKILDCVTLTEEQNRFLGKITFNISFNSELLSKVIGGNICIESIEVDYSEITVVAPQIMITANGSEVSLNKINGNDNSYEGKISNISSTGSSTFDKNALMKKLITLSGIETYMKNGVITLYGNICGIQFCAQSVYDGYLNGYNCPYTIANNANLLQSGVVISTSENTETVITNSGILNKYNENNFYGYLCLENCSNNNWITAYFNNEFCINCIDSAESYDGSGTFEALVYGTYKSSLNLYSISKEYSAVYGNVYE